MESKVQTAGRKDALEYSKEICNDLLGTLPQVEHKNLDYCIISCRKVYQFSKLFLKPFKTKKLSSTNEIESVL